MYKLIVLCGLYFICAEADAQYRESIRTDRPGQAIGPLTVGKGIFQTQTGIDYGENVDEKTNGKTSSIEPGTVLRFGIAESTEINAAVGYMEQEYERDYIKTTAHSIRPLQIGMRFNLREGTGNSASIGMQYRLKFPSPLDDFNARQISSKITFAIAKPLGAKTGINTNFGADWQESAMGPIYFYVLNFSYSLGNKWGVCAEQYGTFDTKRWIGKVDGGFSYLINSNLQLDTYGGWGSFGNGPEENNFFVSFGVSWRTTRNMN